ncbi:MAG: hypothetical protein LBS89_04865, partial [Zoogloeaceae bacterium]|nr:hypothetical protein [Zoogloeaceae bacterium]
MALNTIRRGLLVAALGVAFGGISGSALALQIVKSHGYIPHIKSRGQEAKEKKHNPVKKPR